MQPKKNIRKKKKLPFLQNFILLFRIGWSICQVFPNELNIAS